MPNHYTSVCTVTGPEKDIAAFRARCIVPDEDKLTFDFKTVVPMPACVANTERGSQADAGFFALTGMHHVRFAMFAANTPMHAYVGQGFEIGPLTGPADFKEWLSVHSPECLTKGAASLACFRETGHLDWYDWSYANWGTKWNAYQYRERLSEPGKLVFEFQTANGVPCPVFEELARLYPSLVFQLTTIDEGGPEYESRYSATEATCSKVEHSAERYRLVYGRDPYRDEETEESAAPN